MWMPRKVVDWFEALRKDADVNSETLRETISLLREDLAAVRADRDATKLALISSQINSDWMRIRVNTLETERAQLIEKAYGIHLPVPEIVRASTNPVEFNMSIFEDMGDDEAKKLGMPIYGK